jgi:tRNA uridine 5-carboxymethylaminomethyl modification enzyme
LENCLAGIVDYLVLSFQYAKFQDRQQREIEKFRRSESVLLPSDLDYRNLAFLSTEEVENLSRVRPQTIGAASRVSGLTPSSLVRLLYFVQQKTNKNGTTSSELEQQ